MDKTGELLIRAECSEIFALIALENRASEQAEVYASQGVGAALTVAGKIFTGNEGEKKRMFILGILFVAAGIGLFIFGLTCDEYTTFTEVKEGDFWEIPGYGTAVLIGVAVLVIAGQLILSKYFGLAQNQGYLIGWYAAAAIMAKLGLVALPLVLESGIFLLLGLEYILPEAMFQKVGDAMGSVPGGIGFLILLVVVSVITHNNNLND